MCFQIYFHFHHGPLHYIMIQFCKSEVNLCIITLYSHHFMRISLGVFDYLKSTLLAQISFQISSLAEIGLCDRFCLVTMNINVF